MSVPTNLVEGVGQKTAREFAKFIRIALNSANELEYHLQLARDFDVMEPEEFSSLLNQTIRVRKMLHGLLRSIGREPSEAGQKSSQSSSPATGNGASRNPQRVTSARQ